MEIYEKVETSLNDCSLVDFQNMLDSYIGLFCTIQTSCACHPWFKHCYGP